MTNFLVSLSRLSARFHLWRATAVVLWMAGPFAGLGASSAGRLSYALMMRRESPTARWVFLRVLRRELGRTCVGDGLLAGMAQRMGRISLAAAIYRRTIRGPSTLWGASAEERRLAGAMADLTGAIAAGKMKERIAAIVDALGLEEREPVTLIAVSERHFDLFGLWLEQARRHLAGRVVGMALDTASVGRLGTALDGFVLDLSPYLCFDAAGVMADRSKNALWMLRVYVVSALVARGHRVISIDLDAVAVGDVDAMLRGFPEADIAAQQDYSIPVDVARQLGFVLCCGFMVFYPTPATQSFLIRYVHETTLELDDQLAINHMLNREKIRDRVQASDYFGFVSGGVRWVCPAKSLVSRDLHTGKVIRHFHQQGQTVEQLRRDLGLGSQGG